MVRVELRTPIYDHASGEGLRWETLVSIEAQDDHTPRVTGDGALLDLDMPVVSLRTGETIHFSDHPEDWTRSLPLAFRAGDLVATVVADDEPITDDDMARAAGHHHHGAAAV